MNRRLGWIVASSIAVVACSGSGDDEAARAIEVVVERDDWGAVFDESAVVGTFVARRVGSGETHVWDAERAAERRHPASTFKILNSMIFLDAGAVADVDTVVPWDGVQRELPEWNRDHSLRSGIKVSAVWMYQLLAREVGEERMSDAVRRTDYGNADIGGGIDQFWLRGALSITPLEQLDFLERMVNGDLPFDDAVVESVREIIVREECDGSEWSHKTGTALADEPALGWLVGTTNHNGEDWVFAMNIDLGGVDVVDQIDPQVRQTLSRRLLVDLGALPPDPC